MEFILNAISIYSYVQMFVFVIMVPGFIILYFMAANNIGPFHVGQTITSADVQKYITANHLHFTPKDYLPTMKARGFTCDIHPNGTYTCWGG
jgi:hypothetical protein